MKSAVWILAGLALSATAWAGEVWKDKQPAQMAGEATGEIPVQDTLGEDRYHAAGPTPREQREPRQ